MKIPTNKDGFAICVCGCDRIIYNTDGDVLLCADCGLFSDNKENWNAFIKVILELKASRHIPKNEYGLCQCQYCGGMNIGRNKDVIGDIAQFCEDCDLTSACATTEETAIKLWNEMQQEIRQKRIEAGLI